MGMEAWSVVALAPDKVRISVFVVWSCHRPLYGIGSAASIAQWAMSYQLCSDRGLDERVVCCEFGPLIVAPLIISLAQSEECEQGYGLFGDGQVTPSDCDVWPKWVNLA